LDYHPELLPTTQDNQDKVSLQETAYNGIENQHKTIDSESVLNESLRITYDRYHLLTHLPLHTSPIEITPSQKNSASSPSNIGDAPLRLRASAGAFPISQSLRPLA
jgi:hypothetical protein